MITSKFHLSALYLAVIGNKPKFVRLLLDAGADINIQGSEGHFKVTPLEYARQHGYTGIARDSRGE